MSKIIITVNLPQPVRKFAAFTEAMEKQWPGTVMQAHNATGDFDDELGPRLTVERDGPCVAIHDTESGATIVVPRSALRAFIGVVNTVGEGPVMLDVDGAATIDIPAS